MQIDFQTMDVTIGKLSYLIECFFTATVFLQPMQSFPWKGIMFFIRTVSLQQRQFNGMQGRPVAGELFSLLFYG